MMNGALRESSEGKATPKMIRFPAMNSKPCDMSRATNRKWSKLLQATESVSIWKVKKEAQRFSYQKIVFFSFFFLKVKTCGLAVKSAFSKSKTRPLELGRGPCLSAYVCLELDRGALRPRLPAARPFYI